MGILTRARAPGPGPQARARGPGPRVKMRPGGVAKGGATGYFDWNSGQDARLGSFWGSFQVFFQ